MPWPHNVTKADLKVQFYRGSGAGGQHRNKVSTACRMTHIPTGITTTAEDSRSQDTNKRAAFRKLAQKLIPRMLKELSPQVESGKSTEVIRTYHECRNVVKDHRTGQTWPFKSFIDGKHLGEVHAT